MSKEYLYKKQKKYWEEKCKRIEREKFRLEKENQLLKDKVEFLQRHRKHRLSFGKGAWREKLKKDRKSQI